MAIHKVERGQEEFYTFWQGHRTAITVPYDENIKQWDTLVLSCPTVPKWKDLPMYFKIPFVEYNGMNETLLHLKK